MSRVALPDAPSFKPSDFLSAARRTLHNAIRPAELNHELTAILELRKVDCVPESSVSPVNQVRNLFVRDVNHIITIIFAVKT